MLHKTPVALTLLALAAACAPAGEHEPDRTANPHWQTPAVVVEDGVRRIENVRPKAVQGIERADGPVDGTRLLFWRDQAVARDSAGIQYVAHTADHEILLFDPELEPLGALRPQAPDGDRLDRPVTVAAGPGQRLAAFEATGDLVFFDRWGREFRRLDTPFAHAIGAWAPGVGLALARSPYRVGFAPEGDDAPLLVVLDPARPDRSRRLGSVRAALSPFYVQAVNAGTVAVGPHGAIYFAALGRPEIEKYDVVGARIWVSRRAAGFETPEPRLVPNPDGPARLQLATVQKALAIGPDGLLYVRSAADPSGGRDRLDVIDPQTGFWLASAPLDTGTAVLVGTRGAVWQVQPTDLLGGPDRERRDFPAFALQTFQGDSLSLDDLNGNVALVSFWASWCGPCRQELPLLDSLHRAIDRPEFEVVGINEDVDERAAREFADELGLSFTNLLGRGRMRGRYHYSGLPYSVLLDRDGRIVREYYGFGGRDSFDREVTARVLTELGAAPGPGGVPGDTKSEATHVHDDGTQTATGQHDPDEMGTSASAARREVPIRHEHASNRDVTGSELERLARHMTEIEELRPDSPADVPNSHWRTLRDGLAHADAVRDDFLDRFAGTPELVRFLALRTQLYVDADRLSTLETEKFPERWDQHLAAIRHLLETYRWYRDREGDRTTSP